MVRLMQVTASHHRGRLVAVDPPLANIPPVNIPKDSLKAAMPAFKKTISSRVHFMQFVRKDWWSLTMTWWFSSVVIFEII